MPKLFYIDVETTGTDPCSNALVQIAGIIEIDGEVKEEINMLPGPFPQDIIEPKALEVIGKSEEQLREYEKPEFTYHALISIMESYVDRYDKKDKFHFVGYNSRFDDGFIREWFKKLNDNYYGSWFYWPAIDVSNMAAVHFLNQRENLFNFKLMTVAEELGIEVDKSQAHDALYDVRVTREMFKVLNGGSNEARS